MKLSWHYPFVVGMGLSRFGLEPVFFSLYGSLRRCQGNQADMGKVLPVHSPAPPEGDAEGDCSVRGCRGDAEEEFYLPSVCQC